MTKYEVLDRVFRALGDPSRRAMVERLARGPASVGDLARPFEMALPTVVEHLGVLERPGSSARPNSGRVRTYQLVPGGLAGRRHGLDAARPQLPAERRLDRLGEVLLQPVRDTTQRGNNVTKTDTNAPSQVDATLVVERTTRYPVATVWHGALRHRGLRLWFTARRRVRGRREVARLPGRRASTETGQWHDGRSRVQLHLHRHRRPHRIVFTYDMWVEDQHLSTSLTTIALEDDGDRTLLTYVEQGVHFDGLDSPEGREEGTKGLLDQLGAYLTHGR